MRSFAGVMVLLALVSHAARAKPPLAANHPIVGVWRLAAGDGRCAETYRFRGDGTSLVTSAREVSESEFDIPSIPSEKGFYKFEDTITKDNGKQACSGEVMMVGTRATNFLRFHPSGEIFLMCATESMETCVGPFERVRGEGI